MEELETFILTERPLSCEWREAIHPSEKVKEGKFHSKWSYAFYATLRPNNVAHLRPLEEQEDLRGL